MSLNQSVMLCTNNQGSISNATNPVASSKMKHVAIQYFKIREYVDNKHISIVYIATEDNQADILTKPLGRVKFEKFRKSLGLSFEGDTNA